MSQVKQNKITPFLWFNNQASEAAEFYTSIFPNSSILSQSPMSVEFDLSGQKFIALNGGDVFRFNEAVSFFIDCENQKEVDYFWQKLTDGGSESQCGWLKDKYGLSWQVVPNTLNKLMSDPNPTKANNVMQAMLKMKKIIVKDLQNAYDSE